MTQDFAFKISRTFNAPRDLVWKAWTHEKQLAQWFGPKGCKMTHSKMDLRPGGTYHYAMDYAGHVMWGLWKFIEIESQEKLVAISGFSDEEGKTYTRHPMSPEWPLEIYSVTRFIAKGNQTEVAVEWKAHNASELEKATFEKGQESMKQGWGGTMEQLEAYLAKLVKSAA